jgi:hypothetical protein
MEISLVSEDALKIKGKSVSIAIDPEDKQDADAALVLTKSSSLVNADKFKVVISGPGDYETGGVKISGIRGLSSIVYTATVDLISITLGKATDLEKLQSKLKESNIVVAYCDSNSDASFLTSITSNVIILYGENASEIGKALAGENAKKEQKYINTIDKLPAEIETVILN